jgi:hypothetical protein
MNEEIQEIERLIKQSGELAESLIQLARKLQQRRMRQADIHEKPSGDVAALYDKLTNLHSYIDFVKREIDPHRHYRHDEVNAKALKAVMDGTATPEAAIIELLRVGVAEKTMTPELAAEQLAKLLRPDLAVSQRIHIREIAKAALSAGDDVFSKVSPFLRGAQRQQSEQQETGKGIAVTP